MNLHDAPSRQNGSDTVRYEYDELIMDRAGTDGAKHAPARQCADLTRGYGARK